MELKLAWIINAGYIDLYFKKKMDVTILNANEIIKFSYEKNTLDPLQPVTISDL